ncbi:bifunctional Biotinyl protein ligase (BPL) and lipoyl protein ligase (LPL) [Babesia duncani]|uniref:lipoate--protein ligase n=1 Tax=Babesia duncani TaxID=323732 RepID=A0AAD9PII7_9APIC|nr:bifunctional Biotinyl protein ligase (BPL) and lipoyl protein ligase (LPL) [Babesia duncani]
MSGIHSYFTHKLLRMTERINVLLSKETDIYFNVALENYLLSSYGKNSREEFSNKAPLLFFWRNSPCVIVGRNQNVWSECNLENIKMDKVNIVRRFTGGGAVYQDLGNSCFTFISPADNYSFEANCNIICSAVGDLIGEKCSPSGRNDLCVNGLKFSGTAFRVLPNAALHHGTLLININKGSLDKYLTPDKSKLEKHNVQSIKSRVTNLAHFKPDITAENVFDAIVEKAVEFYGAKSTKDDAWIFGDKVLDTKSFNKRFEFGNIHLCLDINKNVVERVWIFSDCLNAEFIQVLIEKLNVSPLEYKAEAFVKVLDTIEFPNCQAMISEIKDWVGSILA